MLPIRIILHPTDFSECSKPAFHLAWSLARDYGAGLVVLHVAEPPMAVSHPGGLMAPDDFEPARLHEQLQRLRPEDPKVPVEHRLVQGFAVEEIVRAAAQTKCDLILMGTHGRSGLGRLFVGSVAEQILRKAPCPVVTVKAPQPQEAPVKAPIMAKASSEAQATK